MNFRALADVRPAISEISAPPTKARDPAPVTTIARISGSAALASTFATKSSMTGEDSAFSFAELSIVTKPTFPPVRSSIRSPTAACPLNFVSLHDLNSCRDDGYKVRERRGREFSIREES